jgi:hypothetical protein
VSYYLVIGGEEQQQLASIQGWSDFKDWAEDIDLEQFWEIAELAANGVSEDLPKLEEQLQQARNDSEPESLSVTNTLDNLINLLSTRPAGAASAFVTDGLGPDDGTEDWEDGYDPAFDNDNVST